MDLIALPSIVWYRRWLVLAVALLVTTAAGFALRPGKMAYETTVRVQLTTPQQEEIALLDQYRSTDVRDEATLARNNFMVVLKSPDVVQRTTAGLQLTGDDALYTVDSKQIRDTNFIDVVVRATTPQLATEIANAHVNEGIRRYGELRAKPAAATKELLGRALQASQPTANAVATTGTPSAAADAYQALLKKYAQAAIAEQGAQQVSYIQVIDPAATAIHIATTKRFAISVGLAALGGLGLGSALAIVLASSRRTRVTVRGANGPTIHFDFVDDDPIVVPPTRREPLHEGITVEQMDDVVVARAPVAPVALPVGPVDPEVAARGRVERALALARPVLIRAEREVAPDQDESLGEALRTLRAVAFDQQKALEEGTPADEVAHRLRSGVESVIDLVALVDVSLARSLAAAGGDLEALVRDAMSDTDAADLLTRRGGAPLVAIQTMRLLAKEVANAASVPAPSIESFVRSAALSADLAAAA